MRAGFRLLRTQAFRIVLVYVVLFALSVAALLYFTYWKTRSALDAQTDQIIEAEISGLFEQYPAQDLRGLVESVTTRSLSASRSGSLYVLADSEHRVLAGNLDSWPAVTAAPG